MKLRSGLYNSFSIATAGSSDGSLGRNSSFNRLWRAGVSLAVVSGLVLLIIVKLLGVFGSLYGLFRQRSQRWKDDGSARPSQKT
jgi:hypothetical protein